MSSRDKYNPEAARIQYSDPQDPWALIDTPFSEHPMPAWKASTMATGTMGVLDEYMKQFRAQFDELRGSTDELITIRRELDAAVRTIKEAAAQVAQAARQLAAERSAFEQQRADAAKFDEEISLPPGMGEELAELPGDLSGADEAASGAAPGGELHTVEAKIEPSLDDDQGALPAELLKDVPPETGNYPTPDPKDLDGPSEKQVPQPTSVSLW
jgi:hypothetical protein